MHHLRQIPASQHSQQEQEDKMQQETKNIYSESRQNSQLSQQLVSSQQGPSSQSQKLLILTEEGLQRTSLDSQNKGIQKRLLDIEQLLGKEQEQEDLAPASKKAKANL